LAQLSVSIIGMGYVGLVTGVTFAKLGHKVVCTDVLKDRVESVSKGHTPFFEPGLDDVLNEVLRSGNFIASTDVKDAIKDSDISFICVGTPSQSDGSIDLEYIRDAARDIGEAIEQRDGYHVAVTKSTVVPLTTENVVIPIIEEVSRKRAGIEFGVCVNPEFLREGEAVHDSFSPDRIVLGQFDKESGDLVAGLYESFDCPLIRMDLRAAEMVKYTSNSFLATKIAFSNEIANLCEECGIDVYEVMEGVGKDARISEQFLRAGCGFGGSCFPKDVAAIASKAKESGVKSLLLSAVLESNEVQPIRVVDMVEMALGKLDGKHIAVLGLAFKPNTDDVRYSRAAPIIKTLLERGARVTAYDPRGMVNFRMTLKADIEYARSARGALTGVDACIVQTEWDEFKEIQPSEFKDLMASSIIIDGRRTYDPRTMIEAGIRYYGVGWKNKGLKR